MPLITKAVTDQEFVNALRDNRSTLEPDFIVFLDRLRRERRIIVKGLNASQQSYLRRTFAPRIHILRYLDGHLVYLEPD